MVERVIWSQRIEVKQVLSGSRRCCSAMIAIEVKLEVVVTKIPTNLNLAPRSTAQLSTGNSPENLPKCVHTGFLTCF